MEFVYSNDVSIQLDALFDKRIMFILRKWEDSVWLAGGALRKTVDQNDIIADYDLFFRDAETAGQVRTHLWGNAFQTVFTCPNGQLTTHMSSADKLKVQCITKDYYPTPEAVIKTFDLIPCCAITNGTILIGDSRFKESVLDKEVGFNIVTFPAATMKRLIKYGARGYKVPAHVISELFNFITDQTKAGAELNGEVYID
jgi:hypothetical protein